ncbi:MAG: hypothetical protein IVW53_04630 [Chloroflexi bacterium]|nr:hypothetical protein [Chloroflexota bacterium]
MESLNTWANFNRSLWLSSVAGAKTTSGRAVSVRRGVHGRPQSDAIHLAIVLIRKPPRLKIPANRSWKRREEPAWHDPATIRRLAKKVRATNLDAIELGLDLTSNVFADLPQMRNFFAHRNENSIRVARAAAPRNGVSALLTPAEALLELPYGSGPSLVRQWISDLRLAVDLMCE